MPLATLELVATSTKGKQCSHRAVRAMASGTIGEKWTTHCADAPHHTYGVGNCAWKELRVEGLAFELTAEILISYATGPLSTW